MSEIDTAKPPRFALFSRILHWLMAAMVLAMLFIGVRMVSSFRDYHPLLSLHRPLGILILVLVVIRFINRQLTTLPPFPPTMSHAERRAAHVSELLLYTLMFILPLVGWGMLSAGSYPIVLYGSLHLPAILPPNPTLYAVLRRSHTLLAYVLFFTFLSHLAAVSFHTLVVRDRMIDRMSIWDIRWRRRGDDSARSTGGQILEPIS
jgi:cytochrome b561